MTRKQLIWTVDIFFAICACLALAAHADFNLPGTAHTKYDGGSQKPFDPVEYYEQEVLDHPQNWGAWRKLGDSYYTASRYGAAIHAYKESLVLNPENAEAWYGLGNAYFDLGSFDNARQAYEEGSRRFPDNTALNDALVNFHKTQLYETFTKNRENNPLAACGAAKEYLQKYSARDDQVAQEMKDWIGRCKSLIPQSERGL